MRRTGKTPTAGFKAKVALVALKGDKTHSQLAQEFDMHPNQILKWKQQMQERAADVFSGSSANRQPAQPNIKELHVTIGQLTLENNFFETMLTKAEMLSARR